MYEKRKSCVHCVKERDKKRGVVHTLSMMSYDEQLRAEKETTKVWPDNIVLNFLQHKYITNTKAAINIIADF